MASEPAPNSSSSAPPPQPTETETTGTTTPWPTTTKAWTYTRPGPFRQTLQQTTNHPILPVWPPNPPFPFKGLPSSDDPGKEEWLLLRTAYAALNPGDLVTLSIVPFLARAHRTFLPAAVPGMDLTARVLDVWTPDGVTDNDGQKRFVKGDKVVCIIPFGHGMATGAGALQGVLALPARWAVKLPDSPAPEGSLQNPLRDTAGLFLAGITAYIQVKECDLQRGQKVLVVGASGGVGHMAVQLAREKVGKEGLVVGVCSGRNEELVKGLGANEIIDYTAHPDLPAELKRRFSAQPFDAIIDTYGSQPLYRNCASYLKPTGTYHACTIHYNSYTFPSLLKSMLLLTLNRIWPKSRWLGGTGRTFRVAEWMQPSREMMEELVEMCVTGKLRVARDREWEFEELKEAMGVLEGGHARGKVVVKVDGEDGDE